MPEVKLNFKLTPKQGDVLTSVATELLFGGAASGGKSHISRVCAILWALEIPGIQIYFFRRLYDDLVKNHIEGPTGFRSMLAPWMNARNPKSPLIAGKLCEIVQGEIRFWNGSKIFLCHLQHQKDITKYYGVEIHAAFIEEATQFTEYMMRFLRSRLRIPDAIKIPEKYLKPKEHWRNASKPEYLFPRIVYTSNPGGVGHAYMRKMFLDGFTPYEIHKGDDKDGGHFRQYIPARVDDNPHVNREAVKANLAGLPNALMEAMLNGNWNVVIGAYFPQISYEKHVIKPFMIPDHWPRFMAMDWGACGDGDPFSIGWYTVADGNVPVFSSLTNEPLPCARDTLICYRRWNGRGLPKQNAADVAKGIKEREREPILFRVAGGDIMEARGHGESIFGIFQREGLTFKRADMRRLNGWSQVDYRLTGGKGYPLSYWVEEASGDIDTISNLQHDNLTPQDIAAGDDHDADRHRYACMTKPIAPEPVQDKQIDYQSPKRQATPQALIKMLNKPEGPTYVTRR